MAEENQAENNTGAADSNAVIASDNVAAEAATADNGVKRAHRSQKVGAVVSDKMQKTVVVRVDRLVRHTKYRRYVRRTSKFMVHDEENAAKIGDTVAITETRPMSRRKRWALARVVRTSAEV